MALSYNMWSAIWWAMHVFQPVIEVLGTGYNLFIINTWKRQRQCLLQLCYAYQLQTRPNNHWKVYHKINTHAVFYICSVINWFVYLFQPVIKVLVTASYLNFTHNWKWLQHRVWYVVAYKKEEHSSILRGRWDTSPPTWGIRSPLASQSKVGHRKC